MAKVNKTILITGCSSGVGLSIAKKFLLKNWNVIGLSRTKPEILNSSTDFKYYQCDIKDYDDVQKTFSKVLKIDVLINNASIFKSLPVSKMDYKEINEIIDTNLKGTIYCCKEALKKMSIGKIINISSVSGKHGINNQTIYSASKHGVNGFSYSLSQEYLEKNIDVTTICPGGIKTPLWNKNNPYDGDVNSLIDPNEIADLVYFISTSKNGTTIKNVTLFPNIEWH
jgi:uncharacterized protein